MRFGEISIWMVLSGWGLLAVAPAAIWYDAGTVFVEDADVGTPPVVLYDGGPNMEFDGTYHVNLRDAVTNKVVDESPSGPPRPYRTGVDRGDIDLEWWAPSFDYPIPVGRYYVETCWTVHRPFWGIVPDKTVCADRSNVFTVHEPYAVQQNAPEPMLGVQLQQLQQQVEELQQELEG